MSVFGGNKKNGRAGEWLITILRKSPDDELEIIGNGLYWVVQDNSGGWSRLLTKLNANKLVMDGHRAPKSEAALHDDLKDTYDSLVLRGFTLQLPKKPITYSKLVKDLIGIGALPDPNLVSPSTPAPIAPSSVSLANASASEDSSASKQPATPSTPAVPPSSEPNQIRPPAEVFIEEVDQTLERNNVEDGALSNSQVTSEEITLPDDHNSGDVSSDVGLLNDRITVLEDYVRDLEKANTDLRTEKIRLEESLSADTTIDISRVTTAVKATLDTGLSEMSSGMEFRLNREMGHIGKELNGIMQTGIQQPIDDISQQMLGVSNTCNGTNTLLRDVIRKVETLEKVQQNTATKIGLLGTNVNELLKITRAMQELQSGSTPPKILSTPHRTLGMAKSAPTPSVCDYCLQPGHQFTTCRSRPIGYMCIRCRSPRHKEENCPTNNLPCPVCKAVGHASVLHATVVPEERMKILQKFGEGSLSLFKEFMKPSLTAKRLKLDDSQ